MAKRIRQGWSVNKTKSILKKPDLHKQLTLDKLPAESNKESTKRSASTPEKQIIITEINTQTKEDELSLKIDFKLVPSKAAFSTIKADLWFDNQQINSSLIRIPQGALAADEFELTPVLEMKGIPAGPHSIRMDMYELWSSGEKLSQTAREVTVDYVPQTRESRFVKVPSVKSVAGKDLAVVSESEKEIYLGIEKIIKKENISQRDNW